MNQARLEQVRENMKKAGLHQMIVTETEPVYYLTGIWVAPMERMMAVYLDDTGRTIFFGNNCLVFSLRKEWSCRNTPIPTIRLHSWLRL